MEHKWHGIMGSGSRYPSQEYCVINPDKPAFGIGAPGAISTGRFDEVVPVRDWKQRVEALEQCVIDRVSADNWKRRDDEINCVDRVDKSFFLCWRNVSHEQVCNEDGYLVDEVWRSSGNLNSRRDVVPRCLRRNRILRIVDPPVAGCVTAESLDRLIHRRTTLQEMAAAGHCRLITEHTVRYSVYDVHLGSGGERLAPPVLSPLDDTSAAWIPVDDWEDITGDPKMLTASGAGAVKLRESRQGSRSATNRCRHRTPSATSFAESGTTP